MSPTASGNEMITEQLKGRAPGVRDVGEGAGRPGHFVAVRPGAGEALPAAVDGADADVGLPHVRSRQLQQIIARRLGLALTILEPARDDDAHGVSWSAGC